MNRASTNPNSVSIIHSHRPSSITISDKLARKGHVVFGIEATKHNRFGILCLDGLKQPNILVVSNATRYAVSGILILPFWGCLAEKSLDFSGTKTGWPKL